MSAAMFRRTFYPVNVPNLAPQRADREGGGYDAEPYYKLITALGGDP